MFGGEMIVRHKTRAEKEAEDRWWNSLSKEQQRAETERWLKEYNEREAWRALLAVLLLCVLVIAPMVMVAMHLLGY
jgi:hypothetical protein